MNEESHDPGEWLEAIAELEVEIFAALAWHASIEIDGEAATVRRALDVALGEGAPEFVEVAPGQVVELNTHQQEDQ